MGIAINDIAQAIKAKQNERKEYADIDQNSISKIGNTIRDLNNQKAEKEKELKVYIIYESR